MIYKPVAVDFAWFSSGGGLLTDIRALEDTETAAKEAASMFDRDSLHGLRAIAALWRVSSLIVLQSNMSIKLLYLGANTGDQFSNSRPSAAWIC
jgi:hypothetical protein